MTVSTLTVVPQASAWGTAPCAEPTSFYLGTHMPHWLTLPTVRVPLFVSDRRLRRYRTLPHANTMWALDSGGFTELSRYGTWDHGPTPTAYVAQIRRYRDQIGRLAWAAPQDWMCEPAILAKTRLTIADHQDRTVANYLRLRELAPELPIIPVVQGWSTGDYLRCVDRYTAHGVDLTQSALVGVGSVCRRQSTNQVKDILTALHRTGLTRLHGFGVKTLGLARYAELLTSADSMAWSREARNRPPLPGCRHRSCANCPRYGIQWHGTVLATIDHATARPTLFGPSLAGWAA
ncbi:deazapurine DNA modification protein DpdA family protein [Phytohabitans kaempferiae]|uniref:DeoxyPurine in DNA protein A domain-containing protein n=1 Tax=Phytohabitans kaempferiae TaxID=1620943 RepID=A0ABV6LXT7_9ACTN